MARPRPSMDDAPAGVAAATVFRRHLTFWLIALVIVATFVFLFSDILLPFVAGMVLAYFLDPVADRLQRLGLSRTMATILILFSFIIVLTVALIIVIPILATQLTELIGNLPQYLSRLQELITSIDPSWLERTFGVDVATLRQGLNSLVTEGFGVLTTV